MKNEVFADSVGWADVSNQVTNIYNELPGSERSDTYHFALLRGSRSPASLCRSGAPSGAFSPKLSD